MFALPFDGNLPVRGSRPDPHILTNSLQGNPWGTPCRDLQRTTTFTNKHNNYKKVKKNCNVYKVKKTTKQLTTVLAGKKAMSFSSLPFKRF
jgi:hypothetical protein